MKNLIKIITICIIGILSCVVRVDADEVSPPIVIDGVFDDWSDKASLIDSQGDGTNSHQDLKEVKYIIDDEYLYLYVERYPVEGEYKDSGLWDLWIPILNGNGHGGHNCFFPWDKKDDGSWKAQNVSTFKITSSFLEVWDSASQSMVKEFRVIVKINGSSVGEDRAYRNVDGSKIELRLPLSKVGLTGKDEVIFSVGSDIGAANENVDWIYNDGPITSTEGPIFGIFTGILAIAAFLWVGKIAK